MITNRLTRFVVRFALIGGMLFGASSRADILGINASHSYATNWFDDTASLVSGSPGGNYITPGVTPWTGSAWLLSQWDSTTSDFANATIAAGFTPYSPIYDVSLNSVVLSQSPGNTGHANLATWFGIGYDTDANGLPSQATRFPTLLVSGTVQPGGYASIQGTLWYYSNNGGGYTLLDTVNYNWNTYSPGPFANTVNGVAVGGTTPALPAFSELWVGGSFNFEVDPATLRVETVPEPGTLAMGALVAAGLFALRRRLKV